MAQDDEPRDDKFNAVAFKEVPDPNRGTRVEVTRGLYVGRTFAVHKHDHLGIVQISSNSGDSVIVPFALVDWLVTVLNRD